MQHLRYSPEGDTGNQHDPRNDGYTGEHGDVSASLQAAIDRATGNELSFEKIDRIIYELNEEGYTIQ